MKKAIALLMMFSTLALAKEEWQGEFVPPNKSMTNTRGHRPDITIVVLVNIDKSDDGTLDGAVTLTGNQLRCYGEAKINSGKISGNLVEIKSEPLPIHNCGRFIFKGTSTGDTWMGSVPWNGVSNELTLKKIK